MRLGDWLFRGVLARGEVLDAVAPNGGDEDALRFRHPPWWPFSVSDDELTALVRDGNATIPQQAEYSWRVTVASWRGKARACAKHHAGCALETGGPCSIEPRAVGQRADAAPLEQLAS